MDNSGIALAIAKTKLVTDLQTHGVVSGDSKVLFHAIRAAAWRCSRGNVRRARQSVLFLLNKDAKRVFTYLAAFAITLSKRRAVNILNLIHDTLAWSRRNPSVNLQLTKYVTPHLRALLQAAKGPRCDYLVDIWREQEYFSQDVLEAARKPPLRVPVYLGKPNTPYYELPAATMIPHIKEDHASIPSSNVAPVKLPGPSTDLSIALDEMYKRMDKGWQFTEEKEDGEMHYYGWSSSFLARVKK